MKIITGLSGTAGDAPWQEPYNVVASVHVEPNGKLGIMQIGAAGLTLRVEQSVVGIPLGELLSLLTPNLGIDTAMASRLALESANGLATKGVSAAVNPDK